MNKLASQLIKLAVDNMNRSTQMTKQALSSKHYKEEARTGAYGPETQEFWRHRDELTGDLGTGAALGVLGGGVIGAGTGLLGEVRPRSTDLERMERLVKQTNLKKSTDPSFAGRPAAAFFVDQEGYERGMEKARKKLTREARFRRMKSRGLKGVGAGVGLGLLAGRLYNSVHDD